MRILPINGYSSKLSFQGSYANYTFEENIKKDNNWHPASSLQQTLGEFRNKPSGKVYFASPMEPISEKIKESVDFIVYDNEPNYPAIDEVGLNYFNNYRKDFKKDFEELKNYYDRRAYAGFSNTEEARANSDKAQKCIEMYDKGGHLRYLKEQAEDEIVRLQEDNNEISKGAEAAQKELESQNAMKLALEKQIANLEKMKSPYDNLIKNAEKGSINEDAMYTAAGIRAQKVNYFAQNQDTKFANKYERYSINITPNTYKEISEENSISYKMSKAKENAQKEFKKLEKTITDFKSIKNGCTQTINEIKNYIQTLQNKILENNKKIAEKNTLIDNCKSKLIPIFDELKYFYSSQGIQGVKKLK